MPSSWAVTNGSSTTVVRRRRRLGRAEQAGRPLGGLASGRGEIEQSSGERPTLNPKPVWVSSPSSASVDTLT